MSMISLNQASATVVKAEQKAPEQKNLSPKALFKRYMEHKLVPIGSALRLSNLIKDKRQAKRELATDQLARIITALVSSETKFFVHNKGVASEEKLLLDHFGLKGQDIGNDEELAETDKLTAAKREDFTKDLGDLTQLASRFSPLLSELRSSITNTISEFDADAFDNRFKDLLNSI